MNPHHSQKAFSVSEARYLIRDLFRHDARIYWADFLISITIGYSAAVIYLTQPFSWQKVVCFIVAGCALYRVATFMHEVVHLRDNTLCQFGRVWNLLAGVPMLTPSFFYESHIAHHSIRQYGTELDGEYLPFASGRWSGVFLYFSQVFWQPIFVTLRFAVFTPLSLLYPPLRRWTWEHASSFVINFKYRRPLPTAASVAEWTLIELLCSLRANAIFAFVWMGWNHWTRIPHLYALAVFILTLNHLRTLAAHRYHANGEPRSHVDQLLDSTNVTGDPLVTELLCPLGMRYHALHHLFPSLPYHNLGAAHRRLMQELPADSPYREVVYPSIWAALRPLWSSLANGSRRSVPRDTLECNPRPHGVLHSSAFATNRPDVEAAKFRPSRKDLGAIWGCLFHYIWFR
jgi:fatty acid desaturase